MSNTELAVTANAEYRLIVTAVTGAMEHAKRCGEALAAVKGGMEHGQWLPWLRENFEGSTRSAQAYIQLAANYASLPNAQSSAHLSVDGALKALRGPSKPPMATGGPTEHGAVPPPPRLSPEPVWPDEAQRAAEVAETLSAVEWANESAEAAGREIIRLQEEIRVLESQRDFLQLRNAELVRSVKYWKKLATAKAQ